MKALFRERRAKIKEEEGCLLRQNSQLKLKLELEAKKEGILDGSSATLLILEKKNYVSATGSTDTLKQIDPKSIF